MKTRIIAVIGLVLVAGALFFINERRAEKAYISDLSESWTVFEAYKMAVKDNNLEALGESAYKLSATCLDEVKREECNGLMQGVYNYIKDYKQEEFTPLAWDKKQMILVSDYFYWLDGNAPSATRAAIHFVREDGKMKLLSVNPIQGTIIVRNDEATSTVEAMIAEMLADSDNDGLPDKTENCEDRNFGTECIKTNPNLRDTDRDGWWDSTEALFNR